MTIELGRFDAAEYLTDPQDQAERLDEAFASGDARFTAHALGMIARACGMTELATATGLKRQALYRALSANGNPTLETLLKVMKALGLDLVVKVTPAAT